MRTTGSGTARHPLSSVVGAAAPNGVHPGTEQVQVGLWTDPAAWDDFVLRAPDGTMAHRWAWLGIAAAAYGHPVVPLAAVRGEKLAGVLPLVRMRSRIFGRHLVSMPYIDTGGLCTAGDRTAEAGLVSAAVRLAAAADAHLELRHTTDREIPLVPSLHKVTLLLDLSGGEQAVWKHLNKARQRQIRSARRAGLVASEHGPEALGEFHRIQAVNLRDLGSPVHSRAFFERVMDAFGEDARILLVRDGQRTIGAGLMLFQGTWAGVPWAAALRSTFSLHPTQLFYWEAIGLALARGCDVFDFGRSSPGSGPYVAKTYYGARPSQLYWHRLPGANDDRDVQRWQWATEVWRHLPVPVATTVGAAVRGGIPQ